MSRFGSILVVALLQLNAQAFGSATDASGVRFTRDQLDSDLSALVSHLDDAHPDPFLRGGGRVAFHRRVADTRRRIPADGMTADEFYELLLPLVASVGDGHTKLHAPRDDGAPEGLGFGWRILGSDLYVRSVDDESQRPLLGGRLLGTEGVATSELLERQAQRLGYDNDYDNVRHLVLTMRHGGELRRLIPEWDGGRSLRLEVEVLDESGERSVMEREVEVGGSGELRQASSIEIPSTRVNDPAWAFLDEERQVALLRSDTMMRYREAFESWYASGNWGAGRVRAAQELYELANGSPAPDDSEELIAGLPSATATFLDLFEQMKEAHTKTLLVDLRRNQGGNSTISWILAWVLLGPQSALESSSDEYQIRRYSRLYFDNNTNRSIEQVSARLDEPLRIGDYSFGGQREYEAWRGGETEITEEMIGSFERVLGGRAGSAPLFESDTAALYRPENLIVLCSAMTYSAGFDLLIMLYKAGATLVGTPSAQAANCFIDSIGFSLPETGLRGSLSCKYRELFPADSARGEVLEPDHVLTPEWFDACGRDPNAEVLLALEILRAGEVAE